MFFDGKEFMTYITAQTQAYCNWNVLASLLGSGYGAEMTETSLVKKDNAATYKPRKIMCSGQYWYYSSVPQIM